MNCQFCNRLAQPRDGLETGVCDECWQLLQKPTTALPLIRGHLTLTLRGKMPEAELKKKIDDFMGMISGWKRPG
jgi:hypothetical protein